VGAVEEGRCWGQMKMLGRGVLRGGATAESDHATAKIGDRKHHAVGEAVVGNRNVVAGDQQSRLDHVRGGYSGIAEMFLQCEAFRWCITQAELDLHRGIKPTVGEVTTRLCTRPRGERGLEKLRRQLDDV